jgi:hypothetical protein
MLNRKFDGEDVEVVVFLWGSVLGRGRERVPRFFRVDFVVQGWGSTDVSRTEAGFRTTCVLLKL